MCLSRFLASWRQTSTVVTKRAVAAPRLYRLCIQPLALHENQGCDLVELLLLLLASMAMEKLHAGKQRLQGG